MDEFTLETVGTTASTTIALFAARDPEVAPKGSVSVAELPFASLIVPDKADVL